MNSHFININKRLISIIIALLFHVSGFIGIAFTSYREWFIHNTPLNLLLMVALLWWNDTNKKNNWYLFASIAFATGMITEIIGVNTGMLFGNYEYGIVMGIKLAGVPLLIGVQWFVTVYCCGITSFKLYQYLSHKIVAANDKKVQKMKDWWYLVDAAFMATLFDYLMEPVAIKLQFWQWQNNIIPLYNYACWFIISLFIMLIFKQLKLHKENHFATDLLIIQSLFFLSLRTFYLC